MKTLIWFVVALLVAMGLAIFLQNSDIADINPGYVIIGYGRWSLETSLLFSVLVLTILFITLYVTLSLTFGVLRLPFVLVRSGANYRENKAQQAVANAYEASVEHLGPKAEKTLIRHAGRSRTPLMNYLTAARSAQARGAFEDRNAYLAEAREQNPDAWMAIGLTEAELLLAVGQADDAIALLQGLRDRVPAHKGVLEHLQQAYRQKGDWQALHAMIPLLQKNEVVTGSALKDLEIATYKGLMADAEKRQSLDGLHALWKAAPPRVQGLSEVRASYYQSMISLGASEEAEKAIRGELRKQWDEQLALTYGLLKVAEPAPLLATAEGWLDKHSHDVYLLRSLGRLSMQCGEYDKAEKYLTSSVTLYATPDAYMLLGDLYAARADAARANASYRRAAMLAAPAEIVRQMEMASAA